MRAPRTEARTRAGHRRMRIVVAFLAVLAALGPLSGTAGATGWSELPDNGSTVINGSAVGWDYTVKDGACEYDMKMVADPVEFDYGPPLLSPSPVYDVLGTMLPGASLTGDGRPACDVNVKLSFFNWDLGAQTSCIWPACDSTPLYNFTYDPNPAVCNYTNDGLDECENDTADLYEIMAMGNLQNYTGLTLISMQLTVTSLTAASTGGHTVTVVFDNRMCGPNGSKIELVECSYLANG